MSGKATFGMSVVRAAAQMRAGETSLHVTADEIGMSYTGLRGFIAGGSPQPKTRRKLLAWYIQHRSGIRSVALGQHVLREDLDAAISLLAFYLRAEGRENVRARRFQDISGKIAEEGGVPR